MEKKLYFQLTDNEDMNVTVHDLESCKEIIDTHVSEIPLTEIEEYYFTITPVLMTEDEYEALGESESY